MNKLRNYLTAALGVLSAILAALLMRKTKQASNLESALATEKANTAIKENDHDREIAKQHADDLVRNYDELKRKYDDAAGGAGGDSGLS
jgi:hypothetical protein